MLRYLKLGSSQKNSERVELEIYLVSLNLLKQAAVIKYFHIFLKQCNKKGFPQ